MAERLPVGATKNSKPPSLTSFGASPAPNYVSAPTHDRLSSPVTSIEPDLNGVNGIPVTNGLTTNCNHSLSHNRLAHSEVETRNGSGMTDGEPNHETEWVEHDEPGVYITLMALPGGVKDLKRVRFRYVKESIFILSNTSLWQCLLGCVHVYGRGLSSDGFMCATS